MASQIPAAYRLLFTLIEPLFATAGALQALIAPTSLLSATLPSIPYSSTLSPLFTQMTGSWLMLAFHDFVSLRGTHDVRIWRHTLAASAISDVFYTTSLVQSMGSALFFNPLRWSGMDAVVVVMTVGPFLGKVCFLAGVGLSTEMNEAKGGDEKKRA